MSTTIAAGDALHLAAGRLVAPAKGILAADESNATMNHRLETAGIEPTLENRRRYRELLLTTPGIERHVSGVILYDETLRQSHADGTPFPELLQSRGIMPGIKVDTGPKPLPEADGETVTEGLDGLRERLGEYRALGAGFAKWRAVIRISDTLPSDYCIAANAHALARYAALCQEAGIIPIVEPEVLMDGDHPLARCEQVTAQTLTAVFTELRIQRVDEEAIVLKPSMVLAGHACRQQPSVEEVAQRTLCILRRSVPAAVPGIAFLSGGQSDELAAAHLDALNRAADGPWQLTFSYGRALIAGALRVWAGSDRHRQAAQQTLAHRAHCNAAARAGRYRPELETDAELAETVATGVWAEAESAAAAPASVTVPA